MSNALTDSYGRAHDELRVSVTDRCNLRCRYCMPEEPEWFPRERLLTFEEIERLVRLLARLGVRRVRLTGGEPLLRRGLPALVARLAAIEGIDEVSLTTNAMFLEGEADALARAGLRRVNVSLDTLDPERFRRLTGRDGLEAVLRGMDAAERAGLVPVKINVVLLRGVNDDEALDLAAMGRRTGREVRFIEVMPLENAGRWTPGHVVPGEEVRRRIAARWPLVPDPAQDPHAPATRYRYTDGGGRVGFVDSVTRPFCATCTRLRLSSDGQFSTCLYATESLDLRSPLRAGADDETLGRALRRAVLAKGRGGALEVLERRSPIPILRTMHQVGG